jgi:hypothetical protein
MAVKVKSITLWRKQLENKTGVLAQTLEPLAKAGTDLLVVMGYRHAGDDTRAAVELYPIASKKSVYVAQQAGLAASSIPTLLVEGDNRKGLGYSITQAIAESGVNMAFLVAQVVGRRYSAVLGFESETDAKTAAALIKKATAKKKK